MSRSIDDALDLSGGDLPGHLPGQPADLPLELADARLAGVAGDHLGERLVGDRELLRRDPVLRELPGDEVLPGDLPLLPLGVAGELHHLHPVEQRPGDVLDEVRRGDEQHLAQVERHAEVVVHEGVVLRRVEHLEQRARRVALERDAELVHLVQQEHRVLGAGLLHALDDPAGHGARRRCGGGRGCRPRRARRRGRCGRTSAPSPGRSTWRRRSCRRPEGRRRAGSGPRRAVVVVAAGPARSAPARWPSPAGDSVDSPSPPSTCPSVLAVLLDRPSCPSCLAPSVLLQRSCRTARNSSTRSLTSPSA